ncbi:SDR family oxidoreductase [Streptomyces aurantiacus]|uniref:Putative 2,4-dienoyl-CoA reductase n=1 Tax=Streptomyces aurantiacus JA 4570 TaxID=1286094 RepID=S3ZTL2_9ACTN|nr:SDR family oxidoreductase [Streptomyces aurantiacus]EPH46099.1 putative 2,4-dienoyl-CoA reductase [Streptomyces aurantiacus JA 4570]
MTSDGTRRRPATPEPHPDSTAPGPHRGLPAPPPLGATALPPGTYDGTAVLVTGGGSGLGLAIAAEFARLGADLVIASRSEPRLTAARAELAALGGRVATAVCDIRDPDRVAAAFDAAESAYGLPGVLVNNAAANFPVPADEMSPNAWRAVVDATLTGTFFMTREFARRHLAAGTPASVINIGASYAWTGGPGFAHSAAAKAGVKSLVETLAVEWGPYGIQVNGLVPGLMPHEDMTPAIRTALTAPNAPADPNTLADLNTPAAPPPLASRQPALRVGAPRELGWAATFLASPYARFITGHTLVVDGANWQRRSLVNPPVMPVREQLGRDGAAAFPRP